MSKKSGRKCGECIHCKVCGGWDWTLSEDTDAESCTDYKRKRQVEEDKLCGGCGWLEDKDGFPVCPECGRYAYDEGAHPLRWFPNFCPHCGADLRKVDVDIYDRCDIYENCTVQVLTNTLTGKTSVGWFRG